MSSLYDTSSPEYERRYADDLRAKAFEDVFGDLLKAVNGTGQTHGATIEDMRRVLKVAYEHRARLQAAIAAAEVWSTYGS